MSLKNSFFASRKGIILVGLLIGIIASLLQKFGNPANMGICVACMLRDITGALGLHRADVVQYIRPEMVGMVLGALTGALIFKEFKARTGSAPVVRFILGFLAMTGALVFLGCSWRAILRLAGGDLNAIPGILGLLAGCWIGVYFIKSGYTLGASRKTYPSAGFIMPLIAIGILLLLLFRVTLPSGVIFFSVKGPGSNHAPVILSLTMGIIIGFLAQRTRFCTIGGLRDMILMKDFHLTSGILSFLIGAFIMNLIFNQFHPGFTGQPIAHTNFLWNFAGMVLAGLAFTMAGGCPARQLFLSGEGDGDASIFVIGMVMGAAFCHNFNIASSPAGVTLQGMVSVIAGLIICVIIGLTMKQKV